MSQSWSEVDVVPKPRHSWQGRRRASLTLVPVLVAGTLVTCGLGFVQKLPCQQSQFDFGQMFQRACYTDIHKLYYERGLATGNYPLKIEYPVLTGWFMQGTAMIARLVAGADAARQGMAFYWVNVLALIVCALLAVLATVYVAGRNGLRAGLMVALSPALLLAAYINWDLFAVALSALALAAWAKRRPAAAGVLLGLAISAKFYPLFFLGPLVLLCARAGQWRALGRLMAAAATTWLVVNVPIMYVAWDDWVEFYSFSQRRPIDWGSIFYLPVRKNVPILDDPHLLNVICTGAFLIMALGIAVLALAAKRRPRLPQLLFLVVAAFLLSNKVWSPQYVLWLLPLAVLARPKLGAYLLWQAAEVAYFFGIWGYLDGAINGNGAGITEDDYFIPLVLRFSAVLLLAALVVWDILNPHHDLVRRGGQDDPAGGVLDKAEDKFKISLGGSEGKLIISRTQTAKR